MFNIPGLNEISDSKLTIIMDTYFTREVLGIFQFVVCKESSIPQPSNFSKDNPEHSCYVEEVNVGDIETTSNDFRKLNDAGSGSIVTSEVCERCGKFFRTRKLYLVHLYQVHPDHSIEKTFKCEKCPKRFQKKFLLSKHINVIHSDSLYQCNLCTSTFKSKQSFKRHYKLKHDK